MQTSSQQFSIMYTYIVIGLYILGCGVVLRFLIAWLYKSVFTWCYRGMLVYQTNPVCFLSFRNRLSFVTIKFALDAGHVGENALYKNNNHELRPVILDSHCINNSLDTFNVLLWINLFYAVDITWYLTWLWFHTRYITKHTTLNHGSYPK